MTAFSDITAAIVAKLSEAPALASGNVQRGHVWPMPEAVDEMIFVRPTDSLSERTGITGGPVDWTTSYLVEIRMRYTPDTESADAAIDALIGDVFERLAALSLAGMEDVIPGVSVSWDYSEADVNVMGATVRADIVHRTQSSTLTAWT